MHASDSEERATCNWLTQRTYRQKAVGNHWFMITVHVVIDTCVLVQLNAEPHTTVRVSVYVPQDSITPTWHSTLGTAPPAATIDLLTYKLTPQQHMQRLSHTTQPVMAAVPT